MEGNQLTGLDKAAVLLMAVGQEYASRIFANLTPQEAEQIGIRMASLEGITRPTVESSINEFVSNIREQTSLGVRNEDYLKGVLINSMGSEKAQKLFDRIARNGRTQGLDSLRWLEPKAIVDLVRFEHPQIVALMLSYVDGAQASRVIQLLPEELKAEVVMRIAAMDEVPPNALRELDRVLEQTTSSLGAPSIGAIATPDGFGGVNSAAAILNGLPPEAQEIVMEKIKEENEDLQKRIEDQMFIFEDLNRLDDRGIQTLLREVSTDDLVLALKGASEEMNDKILRNMSSRAAELLKDDMDARGPVRLSEVEESQKRVCDQAKAMADEGKIMLGGGEDMV